MCKVLRTEKHFNLDLNSFVRRSKKSKVPVLTLVEMYFDQIDVNIVPRQKYLLKMF